MILTHGDFKIKEQLGKCNEKCKIGLHLENYDDNFNFCWKEFFPSELEGVLEKHAERNYGYTSCWVSARLTSVSRATSSKTADISNFQTFSINKVGYIVGYI